MKAITGHHAGGKGFTGLGTDKDKIHHLYVNHIKVQEKLEYLAELRKEQEVTAEELRKFEIKIPSAGYNQGTYATEQIETLNDKLVARVAKIVAILDAPDPREATLARIRSTS